MNLYTTQLCHWRLSKSMGILLVDITVKSGDGTFSPTRDLLNRYQYHGLSEADYRREYIELMRQSYRVNKTVWLSIANMPKVTIACYCKAGQFCHRHILAELFERVCHINNIPYQLMKEITP